MIMADGHYNCDFNGIGLVIVTNPSKPNDTLQNVLVMASMPESDQKENGEISMLINGQKAWCVAKPAAPQHALQSALDYACNYADCSPTKKGGSCYDPDRPVHQASFAMNAYYQKMGRNQWNCHLNNTSLISLADPRGSGPPLPQEKEDTWCVPKPGTPDSALQNIINFTCGILKECSEIQEHGSCYFPNTLINHAARPMDAILFSI
ncbi:glycosyl hydrolase family 17 protein [Prunus dulcis]|uniref:Glycosyl hydrolase family 17 protein n=1 Tax=Prunus dulcis TaxID=3755 RepID=A0A4Y1RAN2_PRUDU|nr:glycosyl hydrolase family 17 protein [Prunus dulcis]